MADTPPPPAPDAEDGGGRQLNPARVLAKLQEMEPRLVQLAVHQVVVEDQEAEIRQLRAELVRVTAAGGVPEAADATS